MNKKSSLGTKIIIVLFIILMIISLVVYKGYSNKLKAETTTKEQTKIVNEQAKLEVTNWDAKAIELKNTYVNTNKLEVLQGEISVKDTYTKDTDIVKSKTGVVNFLKKKFAELKMEEVVVETSFQYVYTYNVNNLDIKPNSTNSGLIITLRQGDVDLNPISELSDKRTIHTEEGLFGDITAQETGAILGIVQIDTYNKLIKDNELYKKSLVSAKTNLEKLLKDIDYNKNISVVIDNGSDFIDGEEVVVLENTSKTK